MIRFVLGRVQDTRKKEIKFIMDYANFFFVYSWNKYLIFYTRNKEIKCLMDYTNFFSFILETKIFYLCMAEYKIPGSAAPDGRCIFTYQSSSQKRGSFNSPRHPSNYPSNTTCSFSFFPLHDELVEVVFISFKIRNAEKNVTAETNDTTEVGGLG